jgi:hypothetical protein
MDSKGDPVVLLFVEKAVRISTWLELEHATCTFLVLLVDKKEHEQNNN